MDSFTAIAGLDSLQALVLALEYATNVIPHHAGRVGARAQWLGDEERLIFARHTMALGAENAVTALLGRLKQASSILDAGTVTSAKARRRAIDALNVIGAPVGERGVSKRPRSKAKR